MPSTATLPATGDTIQMVSPTGGRPERVEVVAHSTTFAVVDNPWRDGYSLVARTIGLEVVAVRYSSRTAALDAGRRLEPVMADALAALEGADDDDLRERRAAVAGDTDLRDAALVAATDGTGVLPQRVPRYPGPSRTGASYSEGYDARRRAAKRRAAS